VTLNVHSQLEQAFRDTLITYAEGQALTELGFLHGVPRPVGYDREAYRAALKVAAYGHRGTPGVTRSFLEAIMAPNNVTIPVTVDPANPQRVTAASGTPFAQEHVGSWVRVDGVPYAVVGPADVDGAGNTYLELCPVETAYWSACDWGSLSGVENRDLVVIPFRYDEPTPAPHDAADDALAAKVIIRSTSTVSLLPASYLQPATWWLLYDAEVTPFVVGEVVTGGISGCSAVVRRVIDNGGTGALMFGELSPPDTVFADNDPLTGNLGGEATAHGTLGGVLQEYDNEVAGGFAVGLTVVGGTSGVSGLIRGLQDDGTAGLLVIHFLGDEGIYLDGEDLEITAVKRGEAVGDSVTQVRPAGQPDGGHLQEDAFEGGDQVVGPFPIYLGGSGLLGVVGDLVEALLPAGFHVVVATV